MRVVAAAFTSVLEAHLARSVLEAAGIEAWIADEHTVSMDWTYSNAIGGVKVLVPEDRLPEAQSLLSSDVQDLDGATRQDVAIDVASDECTRCGGRAWASRLSNRGLAIASWFLVGFPLGVPLRRRYCRQCGAAASDGNASAEQSRAPGEDPR
jgi:hypothetical protein